MGAGDVLHLGQGFGADRVGHQVAEGVGAAFAGLVGDAGGVQRAVEDGGRAAFVPFQVRVPAGHRQPVEFPHGGADDDFDEEVQVPHHLFDDGDLLGVFLSKVGFLRLDGVEEFGNDGGHAAEMTGAHGSLEEFGQRFHFDPGLKAGRVHLLLRGCPDHISAFVTEFGQITFQIAGVGGQVLGGTKLGGVDEDAGNDGFTFPAGDVDEGEMPRMEVAHGGDEAEGFGEFCEGSAEGREGGEGLHGSIQWSVFRVQGQYTATGLV